MNKELEKTGKMGVSHEYATFIKVFHLPGYSSNLNQNEYLNRALKSNLNNKPLGRAKGKMEKLAKA
nr:hypothetical protein [uncultured bacterium]